MFCCHIFRIRDTPAASSRAKGERCAFHGHFFLITRLCLSGVRSFCELEECNYGMHKLFTWRLVFRLNSSCILYCHFSRIRDTLVASARAKGEHWAFHGHFFLITQLWFERLSGVCSFCEPGDCHCGMHKLCTWRLMFRLNSLMHGLLSHLSNP